MNKYESFIMTHYWTCHQMWFLSSFGLEGELYSAVLTKWCFKSGHAVQFYNNQFILSTTITSLIQSVHCSNTVPSVQSLLCGLDVGKGSSCLFDPGHSVVSSLSIPEFSRNFYSINYYTNPDIIITSFLRKNRNKVRP